MVEMAKKIARTTSEQRQTDRMRDEALSFKDEVTRVRGELVIGTHLDLLRTGAEARFGREMVSALYEVLSDADRLMADYSRKLGWLRDAVAEQERNVSQRRFYSGTPIQNVDDLNTTYGRLEASTNSAARLCRTLGIYCESLHSEVDRATRGRLLAYAVVHETDGQWRVKNGADYSTMPGGENVLPGYDEEWKAWSVVKVLVHGR